MQGSNGSFATDENGIVKPNAIFMPLGEPSGSPIDLLYFGGVHYCLLHNP